jgi:hypothetical protein
MLVANNIKIIKMKILVSSKSLAALLLQLNARNKQIISAELNRSTLTLRTEMRKGEINVEVIGDKDYILIDQRTRHWSSVCELLDKANEQPVVLEIRLTQVSVIFQY